MSALGSGWLSRSCEKWKSSHLPDQIGPWLIEAQTEAKARSRRTLQKSLVENLSRAQLRTRALCYLFASRLLSGLSRERDLVRDNEWLRVDRSIYKYDR